MFYYLASWQGTGREGDPFRPSGVPERGWSAIDLRPDTTRTAGWCLCASETPLTGVGVLSLGDGTSPLSTGLLTAVAARLGVSLTGRIESISELLRVLLTEKHAEGGWKPLQAFLQVRDSGPFGSALVNRFEIWLANEVVWSQEIPLIAGGAQTLYESFEKADSTTLGPNYTWTEFGNQDIGVISNSARNYTAANQSAWASVNINLGTDHWAQATVSGTIGGVVVRHDGGTAKGYYPRVNGLDGQIPKINSDSTVTHINNGELSTRSSSTAIGRVTGTAIGSTMSMYWNGQKVLSITDTSFTAGQRAGVGAYGSGYVDEWVAGAWSEPVAATKTAAYTQSFPGTSLPTGWAATVHSGTVNVSASKLNVEHAIGGTNQAHYTTRLDFLNSSAHAWVVQGTTTAQTRGDSFGLEMDSSNRIEWMRVGESVVARVVLGGVTTDLTGMPSYSQTNHAWRRLRSDANNIVYWESSPDSTTWTVLGSTHVPFPLTNLQIRCAAFGGNATATGVISTFDQINLGPSTTPTVDTGGTMQPSAVIRRVLPPKIFTGSATLAGAFSKLKAVPRTLTGSMTVTGVLKRVPQKSYAATISAVGPLVKYAIKRPAASIAATGFMRRSLVRKFLATLNVASTPSVIFLGRSVGRVGRVIMTITQPGEIRMRLRRR